MPATRTLANYLASLDTVAAPAGADGYVLYDDSAADVVRQTQTQRAAVDAAQHAPFFWLDETRLRPTTSSAVAPGYSSDGHRATALLFPHTTDGRVLGSIPVPTGWEKIHVDLWWYNTTATAGAVEWDVTLECVGAGDLIGNLGTNHTITPTAPGVAEQLVISQVTTGSGFAVVPGEVLKIRVSRDVPDGLAQTIGLFGVLVRRAS